MIMEVWSLEKDKFLETELKAVESTEHIDKSANAWKMLVTPDGFYFGFFGDTTRVNPRFSLFLDEGYVVIDGQNISGEVFLMNTLHFFVKSDSFDDYYMIREILKSKTTSQVWNWLTSRIYDRLTFDGTLLDCEIPEEYKDRKNRQV